MRSGSATKSAVPGRVTRSTNSVMDCLVAVSFQDDSGGTDPMELSSICRDGPRSRGCLTLLACHRQVESFLGGDEVVVVVVADIDLHPVDFAGEPVAGGPV